MTNLVTYEDIVSICDAHGIGLPVDCVEMVVTIVNLAAPPAAALAATYRYLTYTGQCGWLEVSKEEYETSEYRKKRELRAAPTPSTPAPKNCQTGWADFCKASQHDGVACPADSCDIDDGVRKDHAPSSTAPVHVGDSNFEVWYSRSYDPQKTEKQIARDAYAAGMSESTFAPVAQWQTRYAGDPRQKGSWLNSLLPEWCEETYDMPDHMRNEWEVRPLYAAPPTRPDASEAREQVLEDESDGSWAAFELSHHAQMSDKMDRWPVWLDAWYAAMLAPQSSEKEDQVIAAKQQGE